MQIDSDGWTRSATGLSGRAANKGHIVQRLPIYRTRARGVDSKLRQMLPLIAQGGNRIHQLPETKSECPHGHSINPLRSKAASRHSPAAFFVSFLSYRPNFDSAMIALSRRLAPLNVWNRPICSNGPRLQ